MTAIAADPGWIVRMPTPAPHGERVAESVLSLGDGRFGTRGSLAAAPADDPGTPGLRAAGVYRGDGPETELLPGPLWNLLRLRGPVLSAERVLDLRRAVLHQRLSTAAGDVRVSAFASGAGTGTMVLRADADPGVLEAQQGLAAPDGTPTGAGTLTAYDPPGGIAAAVADQRTTTPGGERLDRVAGYAHDLDGPADLGQARERAARGARRGVDRLLRDHRRAWAQRWRCADITIEGDPDLQLATRLAIYHLIASTPRSGAGPVGARGLTGAAYRGHVFWDADVFVLPFHAATNPAAARAMLRYREATLAAARANAAGAGRAGASFAWESAADGREVTPTIATLPSGATVAIRTGELEDHIVADVAWAARWYRRWTGDARFAAGGERLLLTEAARFWASRISIEHGRAHIRHVIGPDEYHEDVDDNAYTNVMARWTLEAAACDSGAPAAERAHWRDLAGRLVDGYDATTRRYEQFAGFDRLEPLVIAEEAPRRPISATLLLGADRVARSQVVKQADVLMLHYLVPESVAPGSLSSNLDHYEPLTAHGSTLSPGVHAALMARAGRPEAALEWLRVASRIDLDDLSETTGGGIHMAALGTVWRALAWGFAGLSPTPAGDALAIDARPLPEAWRALEVRAVFGGARLRVRVEGDTVTVTPARPIPVRWPGSTEPEVVGPDGTTRPIGTAEETGR